MSDVRMNKVLEQMQSLVAQAKSGAAGQSADLDNNAQAVDFSKALKTAISEVSEMQMKSGDLQKAFERGDPNITLAEVAVAGQKAGIAFDAMVQVRNRLVKAYQDIMNMPI